MTLAAQIKEAAETALQQLYPEIGIPQDSITVNITKPEFNGDYTLVLFPLLKLLRQTPVAIGDQMGAKLKDITAFIAGWEVAGGFLNLFVSDTFRITMLLEHFHNPAYGAMSGNDSRVMVEYSSPNTNKPLHFGHLRNNFLGYAVAALLKNAGYQVIKANLINDRGIHICKSMIAWIRYGNGITPETADIKGDHLVGDYYVKFNEVYKEEMAQLMDSGMDEATAAKEAPIMKDAQELLRKWEAGDKTVYAQWEMMNKWVYQGFDTTYQKLGIDFDKIYYESETYLLGKEIVVEGLQRGVLLQEPDGSVWIDLTAEGLDRKLLLRGDGTSVYMTQDLGTARLKYEDYGLDRSIYVIGDEQNYHMQVLQLILSKLGEPCAAGIRHLSYGMVELPTGRMKSREGTVVDADDMIGEMVALAQKQTELAGKTTGFTDEELQELYEMIGIGALKFYLLRVDPKKKMVFDPAESIDLHGFTATFIQYAHARICSILRREHMPLQPGSEAFSSFTASTPLAPGEKKLLLELEQYPDILLHAAEAMNPSLLCQYSFHLAQQFNSFYADHSITQAESQEKKQLRLMLIIQTASVLRHAMKQLGIRLPEKM